MGLSDYTDEELASELASRRARRKRELETKRSEHFYNFCTKCRYCVGFIGHWICSETGMDPKDITGCVFFKEKEIGATT